MQEIARGDRGPGHIALRLLAPSHDLGQEVDPAPVLPIALTSVKARGRRLRSRLPERRNVRNSR
jgi:hypothetical protein